jgi:hypothetical protein
MQGVDETQIGRIYKERVPTGVKWLWFLQVVEAPLPNKGIADTLDRGESSVSQALRGGQTANDGPQHDELRATMTEPPLSVEQRRALEMLATSGRDGAPQALLSAHGFDASLIAGLVGQGLATLKAEKVRVGDKLIAVATARITGAGREALGES